MGSWNKFVGAMETAMGWIAPLSRMMGVTVPEDIGRMKFSLDEAVESVEDAEEETAAWKGGLEGLATVLPTVAGGIGGPDVPGTLTGNTKAFLDTVKEIRQYVGKAVEDIGRLGAVGGTFVASGARTGTVVGQSFLKSVDGEVTTVLPRIVGGVSELPAWEAASDDAGPAWETGSFSML